MGRARTKQAVSRREPRRVVDVVKRGVGLGLLVAGLTGSAGCSLFSSAKKPDDKDAAKRPELHCPQKGAERIETGSWRGESKSDVVRVFSKSPEGGAKLALSCREVDLNGDGRKDVLVFYDPLGRKQREEFDHDFDGVADVVAIYQEGQLVRQELDADYDGTLDLVEHYEGGRRVRVEKKQPEPRPAAASPDASTAGGTSAPAATGTTTGPAAGTAPAAAGTTSPAPERSSPPTAP
ncbi:MAG: hypothetical protein U1A78_05185 [Polyangia bacterium]